MAFLGMVWSENTTRSIPFKTFWARKPAERWVYKQQTAAYKGSSQTDLYGEVVHSTDLEEWAKDLDMWVDWENKRVVYSDFKPKDSKPKEKKMATTEKIELKGVVSTLRKHAAESQAFNAIAHVFAMRERARQQVTVTTLYNTMVKEGFKFTKADYAKELEYLARLGIGKLEKDRKDRVKALTKIGVTLQSLGMAAIAKEDHLKHLRVHSHYMKLPKLEYDEKEAPKEAKPIPPQVKVVPHGQRVIESPPSTNYRATLVVESDGKRREIVLASKVGADKILDIITILQGEK